MCCSLKIVTKDLQVTISLRHVRIMLFIQIFVYLKCSANKTKKRNRITGGLPQNYVREIEKVKQATLFKMSSLAMSLRDEISGGWFIDLLLKDFNVFLFH